MSDGSAIEWTDATWNPIVGCSRISEGCLNCYAERFVHRGLHASHRGLTVLRQNRPGWTGEVRLVEERLAAPLSWKRPRRVFVNSLSDLFHENLANDAIAAVFGVMAACPHLTFQVLTKRPERAARWFTWLAEQATPPLAVGTLLERARRLIGNRIDDAFAHVRWPLPNVWLGVTAEDQQRADERIPVLLDLPAAIRFVSYEPALGPVDFDACDTFGVPGVDGCPDPSFNYSSTPGIDWLIVGGESGPGARPFDLAWAESTIRQCRAASVPCFVKQLGAKPFSRGTIEQGIGAPITVTTTGGFASRKGNDTSEWPPELRVREFPEMHRGA